MHLTLKEGESKLPYSDLESSKPLHSFSLSTPEGPVRMVLERQQPRAWRRQSGLDRSASSLFLSSHCKPPQNRGGGPWRRVGRKQAQRGEVNQGEGEPCHCCNRNDNGSISSSTSMQG